MFIKQKLFTKPKSLSTAWLSCLTERHAEVWGSAWWRSLTFCWVLQPTSGFSSSSFLSRMALAKSQSSEWEQVFLEVDTLDIYYLRESSETWEIFDQKLSNQRTRSRSQEWQEGSRKERRENSTYIKKKWKLEEEWCLMQGTILRGWCWRVRLEQSAGEK